MQLLGSDKRARLLAANSVLKTYVDIAQVIISCVMPLEKWWIANTIFNHLVKMELARLWKHLKHRDE